MPTTASRNTHSNRKQTPSKRTQQTNHAAELREQASAIGDDFRQLATTAGAAARGQLSPIENSIREQPLKSMLIAAGVGALIGMFLKR